MNCSPCDCLNIGCFPFCDEEYAFEGLYDTAAVLTYVYEFNGSIHQKKVKPTIGQPVVIPFEGLNEDYQYKVEIYDADGEIVEVDGQTCWTFRLKTIV